MLKTAPPNSTAQSPSSKASKNTQRQLLQEIISPLHPSWIFYAAVWGVVAGLIFGIATEQVIFLNFLLIILLVITFYFCLRKSCVLLMLLSFVLGILVGNYRVSFQLQGRELITATVGQEVLLSGKLSESPDDSKGNIVLRLKDLQFHDPQENPANISSQTITAESASVNSMKVAGTLYATLSGTKVDLERSDTVILHGKLGEGFGTFVGSMYRPELVAVDRAIPGDIFAQAKRWFATTVRQVVPSPEVDLGLGYLMGMKTGLSEDFSEALQIVGMTHVVVASGAHLAILVNAAKKLFGKISKFAGLLIALLMIGGFVMIVGFTPSMTRAALVTSLSLIVGYVGRKFTPVRLISFVAMLTLLIEPVNFLNLGWQLSFASFFGILVIGPRLQKLFYGGKKPPWLASMLLTSLSTCLVCAPILIYNFGSLSLLAFVANLIILPTLPYAMFLIMLCGLTSFWPFLAGIIALPTTWLLDLHIFVVNFLSEKTMFVLNFTAGDARIYITYMVILLFLAWPALSVQIKKFWRKLPKSPKLMDNST